MARKQPSTKAVGDKLERLVASYYEALGYKVTRDCNVDGHQIDLLAEKYISGASLFTVMIEVKSRSGVLGINDVTPFVNTASSLLMAGQIQAAVLVTDGRFSQDAQASKRNKPGIRLSTIHDLEQDLFNYSESLLKICHDYECSPIYTDYIALEGHHWHSSEWIPDIAKYIFNWSKKKDQLLILCGDFGSGKTTLLERVHYHQAKQRFAASNVLCPLFFRLRSMLQYPDLWTFISSSLRSHNHISPTQHVFEMQLNARQFLVLLDGFDEIETGANAQARAHHLKRLIPLLSSRSPCVLSTRPTYFESFDDMAQTLTDSLAHARKFARLSNLPANIGVLLEKLNMGSAERFPRRSLKNVLIISQLSDKQISSHLRNYEVQMRAVANLSASKVKEILYRIYDLEDLMTRPLLLNMVIQTILAGLIDISQNKVNIGPSTLYDMYTQLCAKRDVQNRPATQFLSEEERLRSCREIALAMHETKTIVLKAPEILAAISRARLRSVTTLPSPERPEALERALTDIRVCSFLSFSEDGALRFAHKSYFEFFVAQSLVLIALGRSSAFGEFAKRGVGKEVIYFLGSFARDQDVFGRFVALSIRQRDSMEPRVKDLLRRIAFASGSLLNRLSLAGGTIDDVDLRRVSVSGAFIRSVNFTRVAIRDLDALNWRLRGCIIRDTLVSSSRFEKSSIHVELRGTEFDSCNFNQCDMNLTGDNWIIRDSKCTNTTLRLAGTGRLARVQIEDSSSIMIESDFNLRAGTKMNVHRSNVFGRVRKGKERKGGRDHVVEGSWYDSDARVEFESCTFGGIWIDCAHISSLIPKPGSGAMAGGIIIKNCRGIVMTADPNETIRSHEYSELRKYYPDITFCCVFQLDAVLRKRDNCKRKLDAKVPETDGSGKSGRGDALWAILDSLEAALKAAQLVGKVDGLLARVVEKGD